MAHLLSGLVERPQPVDGREFGLHRPQARIACQVARDLFELVGVNGVPLPLCVAVSCGRDFVAVLRTEEFVAQCPARGRRVVRNGSRPFDGIAGDDGDWFGVGGVDRHSRTFGQC